MDTFFVDIEPTNRCNAKCHFCPRDATPHQGLMTPDVFDQALLRAVEFRDVVRERFGAAPPRSPEAARKVRPEDSEVVVNLCGLGEPLLNRNTPTFVRQTRDAGFWCGLSTNASLLDEQHGRALLDAGLNRVYINAGDRDDSYEDVYKLPFERTRANIERFAELAAGQCDVFLVLVDFKQDREHLDAMKEYWQELGVHTFMEFDVINRGGALFVDHMQFESYAEIDEARRILQDHTNMPACVVPFGYMFIGYDGQYYLCCSDWKKEAPLGSVFETSLEAITRQKLEHVRGREPICKTCNHDPINRLTAELRGLRNGDVDEAGMNAVVEELISNNRMLEHYIDGLDVDRFEFTPVTVPSPTRKQIPVTSR
jgi:MoaA/NifB/PqqE/SkfB family radical SAM enzyme